MSDRTIYLIITLVLGALCLLGRFRNEIKGRSLLHTHELIWHWLEKNVNYWAAIVFMVLFNPINLIVYFSMALTLLAFLPCSTC